MDIKRYIRYELVDNGSGFQFSWVSNETFNTDSQQDQFRTLLKRVFIEEKIHGSREVIELARKVTALRESELRTIFGRGVDCTLVKSEELFSHKSLKYWYAKQNAEFVNRLRDHLLFIPFDSDIYDIANDRSKIINGKDIALSKEILSEYYQPHTDEVFETLFPGILRTIFIQCQYTGRCWSFRTRDIDAFASVFRRRIKRCREQFVIWVDSDKTVYNAKHGSIFNYFARTETKFFNAKLFRSPDRNILARYYQVSPVTTAAQK